MIYDPSGSLRRTATFQDWLEGARLRTLPLVIAPVILGTGVADADGRAQLGLALLALVVGLALQVGVNFANDYSDGIRGTDQDRVGPVRLTGSRLARPSAVKRAAFTCFGVAALSGLILALLSGFWWLILVGVACVIAAWFYTGGTHPYGYIGLGEVMVFIFFGLVATEGTELTQSGQLSWLGLACAVALGLFSCGVLMINNIRDIETDAQTGKRTLAVFLGSVWAKVAYVAMVLLPFVLLAFVCGWYGWAGLAFVALVPTAYAIWRGLAPHNPKEQIDSLKFTSISALLYAVLLAIGLVL